MFKLKIIISVIIFSSLLITTSVIKNKTRVIEKNFNLNSVIFNKEKDLNQSQLDFSYLTSPSMIDQKIKHLDNKITFQWNIQKYF